MDLNLNTDKLNNADDSDSFDALPGGWYAVTVNDAEKKTAKTGSEYLKLTLEVSHDYHEAFGGRYIWLNLNLWHAKEDVVDIAYGQFKKMCKAAGLEELPGRTEDLIGISFAAKVVIKNSEQYGDSNDIKGFDPIAKRFPRAGSAPKQQVKRSGGGAPWAR